MKSCVFLKHLRSFCLPWLGFAEPKTQWHWFVARTILPKAIRWRQQKPKSLLPREKEAAKIQQPRVWMTTLLLYKWSNIENLSERYSAGGLSRDKLSLVFSQSQESLTFPLQPFYGWFRAQDHLNPCLLHIDLFPLTFVCSPQRPRMLFAFKMAPG